MDINCGVIVDGKSSIQEVGQRFFDLIVKTASGQPSKSEIAARILNKRAEDAERKKGRNGKHAEAPRELTPADVEAATLRTELGDQDYERFLAALAASLKE